MEQEKGDEELSRTLCRLSLVADTVLRKKAPKELRTPEILKRIVERWMERNESIKKSALLVLGASRISLVNSKTLLRLAEEISERIRKFVLGSSLDMTIPKLMEYVESDDKLARKFVGEKAKIMIADAQPINFRGEITCGDELPTVDEDSIREFEELLELEMADFDFTSIRMEIEDRFEWKSRESSESPVYYDPDFTTCQVEDVTEEMEVDEPGSESLNDPSTASTPNVECPTSFEASPGQTTTEATPSPSPAASMEKENLEDLEEEKEEEKEEEEEEEEEEDEEEKEDEEEEEEEKEEEEETYEEPIEEDDPSSASILDVSQISQFLPIITSTPKKSRKPRATRLVIDEITNISEEEMEKERKKETKKLRLRDLEIEARELHARQMGIRTMPLFTTGNRFFRPRMAHWIHELSNQMPRVLKVTKEEEEEEEVDSIEGIFGKETDEERFNRDRNEDQRKDPTEGVKIPQEKSEKVREEDQEEDPTEEVENPQEESMEMEEGGGGSEEEEEDQGNDSKEEVGNPRMEMEDQGKGSDLGKSKRSSSSSSMESDGPSPSKIPRMESSELVLDSGIEVDQSMFRTSSRSFIDSRSPIPIVLDHENDYESFQDDDGLEGSSGELDESPTPSPIRGESADSVRNGVLAAVENSDEPVALSSLISPTSSSKSAARAFFSVLELMKAGKIGPPQQSEPYGEIEISKKNY